MNNQTTIAGTAGRIASIVWHGLIVLAVLTFWAGHETGRAVHRANDALAALWRRLWVPPVVSQPEPPQTAPKPLLVAVPVAVHPLAELAAELESLSCRQLRDLGGIRAKRSKHQLIAQICTV